MSRKKVIVIICDRCKREDYKEDSGKDKDVPDFEVRYFGKVITYTDVCKNCQTTLTGAIEEKVMPWNRPLNSKIGPLMTPEEAPPVTVAPDYTPAKPHKDTELQKENQKK